MSPGGRAFDLYDNRRDSGNSGPPDGATFRGRGFIQLTGRANYKEHGAAIGPGGQLVTNPDLANDAGIASRLLASFLSARETTGKAITFADAGMKVPCTASAGVDTW
jgi:peptidoglycan L-alanyl-D-glutamate endopeptidase CwlK